jgi:thiol-disulfide isomerase/thioredoxin/outer membrane protein assembly factor BamD (BamD/ComL family)
MKSAILSLFCGAAVMLGSGSRARAVAVVGDSVQIAYKAVDGSVVNTAALKGKLVVVDFWATWCGPCMQMVPHMVEMNEKYAGKGLVIIGISLDEDRQSMIRTAHDKGMTWPEYFDGTGWGNKFFKQYGGDGIPFTMLLSTKGTVLYAGHPAGGLDEAIENAFKTDPPQLVDPKVLSEASSSLDRVESSIAAGDEKGAINLMAKVPPVARLDAKFAQRQDAVQKKLETAANSMLSEVQTQIDQGKYLDAVPRLKDLTAALTGLPEAMRAKMMLGTLMAKPDVRSAIDKADKESKAADALEIARKLQTQKKDELAYARFSDVVKFFPGTPSSEAAQRQIDAYKKNPAFMKQMLEHAAAVKATAMLHMGDSYKAAGNVPMARKKYQSVIDNYPGTSYAALAQKSIDALAAE